MPITNPLINRNVSKTIAKERYSFTKRPLDKQVYLLLATMLTFPFGKKTALIF